MSFDLFVTGGRPVGLERWQQRIAKLGARLEFHPDFKFGVRTGHLSVAITIEKPSMFPDAGRYRRIGRLAAGFELGIAAAGSAPEPDEQVLTFSTAVGKSGADYLAQVVAAASYALEAGARLDDPQAGERSEGDAILATLARQLTQFLDGGDVEVGKPFRVWE